MLGYILLMQLIALWFAFQIRKVKVSGLNDSKATAAIVYLSSISAVVGAVSLYGIREYVNVYPLVYNSTILVSISVLVSLVFIPKVSHYTVHTQWCM